LALRGEGKMMDKAQRGSSDLILASLVTDRDLIEAARNVAAAIVGDDPSMAGHAEFRSEIELFLDDKSGEFLTRG
jgi:ATP-dependent DNA helicase RecG